MFLVTKAAGAAIRAVFEQEGELSAAIELRRLFPGINDNAKARGVRPDDRRMDATAGAAGEAAPGQSAASIASGITGPCELCSRGCMRQ